MRPAPGCRADAATPSDTTDLGDPRSGRRRDLDVPFGPS